MDPAAPAQLRLLWLRVIKETIDTAMEPALPKKVRQAAWYWLLYDTEDFPTICFFAGIEDTYLRRQMHSRLRTSRQDDAGAIAAR